MSAFDKKGQYAHPRWLLDGFKEVIYECALTEVELTGGNYTWEKSRSKPNWVRERLNLAFGSSEWWTKFPTCKLSLGKTSISDHNLIFLDVVSTQFSMPKFIFKFENMWLKEPSFHDEVISFWKSIPLTHILPRLDPVSTFMARWGQKIFHKFSDKM